MSIDVNMAVLLQDCLSDAPAARRSIMTLGRQTIRIDREQLEQHVREGALPPAAASAPESLNQEWLFGAFGFGEVHSLDVSDYEGCTHLHDLNDPRLPQDLRGRYEVVFNGGTLEHLFDPAQGLRNALAMLAPGGLFIHAGPVNNWEDHGFFQFSPGLMHDYFQANGFECCLSAGLIDAIPPDTRDGIGVVPLLPGERVRTRAAGARVGHLFTARRLPTSTLDKVPKQTMYVARHDDARGPSSSYRAFAAFDLVRGARRCAPVVEADLAAAGAKVADDGVYSVPLRIEGVPGGMARRPYRSTVLLCEDGVPLSRVTSDPEALADGGPGRFCHWGPRLFFRTSDDSDPRRNGRRYSVCHAAPASAG